MNNENTVRFLNKSFADATSHFSEKAEVNGKNSTRLYAYQVEFCYLIDRIQRDPVYICPKVISDANRLIEQAKGEPSDPNSPNATVKNGIHIHQSILDI